ncbi:MAG: ArgE/DapE family deacylase [Proteobacteria bacterium]|nr:ArgE/DapE family deacylase [Pseudomonadota bacterium]
MSYKDAFAAVERSQDYIVDILQKIIRVDTTVPPGENYGKLVDIVEPEFKRYGYTTERVVVPEDKVKLIPGDLSGERVNLVATLKNDKPKVSAYAHMDVVPADDKWTKEPFGGEVVDGKLYGRGTVDMKGSIACFLGAVKVLSDMGIEPNFSVNCCLCTDEELGVYPGTRYLAEQGYFSHHLMWLELGAMEPVVTIGAAGSVRIVIKSLGKSCHSGMNYLGVNAIEELVPIMNELMILKKDVEKRLSRIPAFPLPGAPYDKMTPMFNLNIIQGGSKDNIVPAECDLTINRRYIVDEAYADVVGEIEEAVEKGRKNSKLLDIKIDVVHTYPPVEIDPDNPAVKKMLEGKKVVKGYEEFMYGGISGSTDLGFVAKAHEPKKIEAAGFGLVRASNVLAHAVDEYVYIEDLVDMTKELVHYMAF